MVILGGGAVSYERGTPVRAGEGRTFLLLFLTTSSVSHTSVHAVGVQHFWIHPGGNPVANLKSISHRCHPVLVAFVWELTKETIELPLG